VGEKKLPNLAHVNIADLDFLKSRASVIHKEPWISKQHMLSTWVGYC